MPEDHARDPNYEEWCCIREERNQGEERFQKGEQKGFTACLLCGKGTV